MAMESPWRRGTILAEIIDHTPLDIWDNMSYKHMVTPGRFRKLRESMDYSQAELGKLMNTSGRTVRRWETGEIPMPKMAQMAMELIMIKAARKGKR